MSSVTRSVSVAVLGLAAMVWSSSALAGAEVPGPRDVVPNRAPLEATPFVRLPIGSVRAEGWLLRQLELQKAGLTGSAERLYEACRADSAWLGGKGEAWEKGPYYVRGLVALAHTLGDAELEERAQKWVDWALSSQRPDGSFGPAGNNDWWPRMVVLYYLRDHYEATGDPRVIPFLTNYFRYQLAHLPGRPLTDWSKARAGDNIDVVLWTYNRTGEPFLLDLAKLLDQQAYPWSRIFTDNRFYGFGDDFHPHHIVNVSQAYKTPAVVWQFTHDPVDRNAVAAGTANLDRQYGRIDGQISGTEMLSGLKSTDGVELCADIERIISDGTSVTILGDPALGDRMERVAYNSLPAHTSPTMRQITYYQLLNQVSATRGGHGFTQDYPNGNVPGPHSGFPCCCYNWHAGWPKFVQQMWAATGDGGLALIAYGPNHVTTTVGGGTAVTITQATDYPFAEGVTLRVEPERAVRFPLVLRVPAWCDKARIKINGQAESGVKPGTFHRIAREWKPGDTVVIELPMDVRRSTWVNGSAGIERGPLAFALSIKERWQRVHEYPGGFDEFEVRPQSAWNYALDLTREMTVETHPVSDVPWDTAAPPVTLTATARRLPGWTHRAPQGSAVIGLCDNGYRGLREATVAAQPDVPHKLRVSVAGDLIRVFVDGRLVLEQRDPTVAKGSIGLRAYDAAARFSDVRLDGKPVAGFGEPGAWRTFGGQWAIRGNAYAVAPVRDAKAVLAGRDDLRDFELEVTVTVSTTGNAGVIVRASDLRPGLDGYRGYYVGLACREVGGEDAQEPPKSPVASSEPGERIELVPFGSAKLRVSYFPVLGGK